MNFNVYRFIDATIAVITFMLLICLVYYAVLLLIKPRVENLLKCIAIALLIASTIILSNLATKVVLDVQSHHTLQNTNISSSSYHKNPDSYNEAMKGFGIN